MYLRTARSPEGLSLPALLLNRMRAHGWVRALAGMLALALAALLALLAPQRAQAQSPIFVDDSINDGLVAHFKFDEGVGAVTRDWVNVNLTATLLSGVSLLTSSLPPMTVPNAGTLSLDGTRGVTITASAATAPISALSGPFTFSAWVRRTITTTADTIIQNGDNGSFYRFGITNDSRLRYSLSAGTSASAPVPALAQAGVWTHVALTVDPAAVLADRVRLYANGAQVSLSVIGATNLPVGALYIGARPGGLDIFNGQIEDLRIYSRALTADEVGRLAQGKGCVFDGLSWATALRELQCGLAEVAANGEVWVAQGRYLPSFNRALAFPPARNMTLYGGFVGTESSPAQRPAFNPQAPLASLTLLTGDILGNDAGFAKNGENTSSIIAPPAGIALTLDGVAVRGGNASLSPLSGGGVRFPSNGALRVNNVAFTNNRAGSLGGAIQSNSPLTITAGSFFSNTSDNQGGAIWLDSSQALVAASSMFTSNVATIGGGAIYAARPNVTASTFTTNRSTTGGAIFAVNAGATISGSVFTGNAATANGGALSIATGAGASTVSGSTFRGNSSSFRGGAIRNDSLSGLTVNGSTFSANTSSVDGGAVSSNGALTVSGSEFANNSALGGFNNGACAPICNQGRGGALYGAAAVTVQASNFNTNTARLEGGAVYGAAALNITGGSAGGNRAGLPQDAGNAGNGAGGAYFANSTLSLTDSTLQNNAAFLQGGGLRAVAAATISASTIVSNSAGTGGGVYAGSTVSLLSSKVLSNTAASSGSSDFGGGVRALGATTVQTTTLASNRADGGAALYVTASLRVTATQVLANAASGTGGAFNVQASAAGTPFSVANSLFAGNTVGNGTFGKDLTFNNAAGSVLNSTFASGPGAGRALTVSNGGVTVLNSIFSGYGGNAVGLLPVSSAVVDFVLFDVAQSPAPGPNSLVANPLFVNPGAGNYRLQPPSRAVDAGDDASVPAVLATDLDGGPRKVNGSPVRPALVDLGAYESNPQPPAAAAGGPYSGTEGAPVPLDATGSIGEPPLAFGWDCDNNGSVDTSGGSPTGLACTYPDDGGFVARLVITNAAGFVATALAPVGIANAAPAVTAGPAGQFTGVTLPLTVTLGSFSDAGVLDNPWSAAIAWGDGNVTGPLPLNAQGAISPTAHTWASAGTQTITVTVTDKDGDAGLATQTVTVDPAPVANGDSAAAQVGGSILIPVLANDSGVGLAITSVTTPNVGSAAVESGQVRLNAPATAGLVNITYAVADRNGVTATAAISVTVSDLHTATPTVTPTATPTAMLTATPTTPALTPSLAPSLTPTATPTATPTPPTGLVPGAYLPNVFGKP